MNHDERRQQIMALREQGLTHRAIAERLGLSRTHVSRFFSDQAMETTRRASRDAKRRRIGTCVDCGAGTRYNGHTANGVSDRCYPCGQAQSAAATRAKIGTGSMQTRALTFLEQPRRYSELRDHLGISSTYAGVLLHNLHQRHGLIRRLEHGVYQRVTP